MDLVSFDRIVRESTFGSIEADWNLVHRRWNSFVVNWLSDTGIHEHKKGEMILISHLQGLVFLVCAMGEIVWKDLSANEQAQLRVIYRWHVERAYAVPVRIYLGAVEWLKLIVWERRNGLKHFIQ